MFLFSLLLNLLSANACTLLFSCRGLLFHKVGIIESTFLKPLNLLLAINQIYC